MSNKTYFDFHDIYLYYFTFWRVLCFGIFRYKYHTFVIKTMSKKTRGPNFSLNEKEVLINLVIKYKDVVENKKTDAVTTAKKQEGWRKLSEEFNAISSFCVRNMEQLKTLWENIKRTTRKDKAKTKKEILLTGGGRPDFPPPGPFQGQVEILLGPTLSGMENPFDSDANWVIKKDNEVEVTENEPGQSEISNTETTVVDQCFIGAENEPGPSQMHQDNITIEDERMITIAQEKDREIWNGWSPAALQSKVADALVNKKKDDRTWLQRRRPKSSLHDKILENKLELVMLLKRNAESDAMMKYQIQEQQLKQEKINTEILERKLKASENE